MGGEALPIDLILFNGNVLDNIEPTVVINWEVASQTNNDYFEIQRSIDVVNWETIKTVTGAGNSNRQMSYSIEDENPIIGQSYYRLTQTDYDGKSEVFRPIAVQVFGEEKILEKTINLMGQEVNNSYDGIIIEVYTDGTYVKKYTYE